MSEPLTAEQLAGWRTLADAATGRPWRANIGYSFKAVISAADSDWPQDEHDTLGSMYSEANAEFVAAARDAVPRLLDEIDRLNAATADVESLHQRFGSGCCCLVDYLDWPCPTWRALHPEDDTSYGTP